MSFQSGSASRTASSSVQASDDDDDIGQAGRGYGTGSEQATPRSVRPDTVPRLDLSPAVALHAAALEHPSDDEDELLAPRDQPPAAIPSFDDLSGPDDSDAESAGADESVSDSASPDDGVPEPADWDAAEHLVDWHQSGTSWL